MDVIKYDIIPVIVQITPTEDEIIHPARVACTVLDCSSDFQNSGQLSMHLMRHHKITDTSEPTPTERRFYCPIIACKYHLTAAQCFRTMQLLRQHFNKVHAEKKLECPKCPSRFPSRALLNAHLSQCGKSFRCETCRWTYKSQESLLTHCRRKRHQMPEKSKETQVKRYKKDIVSEKLPPEREATEFLQTKSQTTQTHLVEGSDIKATVFLDNWQKRATESTLVQTIDFPSLVDCPSDPESESTNIFTTNCSVQTEINLNDLNFIGLGENSFPYTSTAHEDNLCHTETQTDFAHLTDFSSGTVDSTLSSMLLTDTHTQTQCDELMFGWTHIETQTCWSPPRPTPDFSDLLISAETQTTGLDSFVDRSSSHTQTTDDGLI